MTTTEVATQSPLDSLLPIDELAHAIVGRCARSYAADYELLVLCSRHHRLVHEGGFRIEKDYQDRWFFKRPDGRAVPACGYRAEDILDDDADVDENDSTNPPAGGLLPMLENSRRKTLPALLAEP